jgi:hypothetical protein
MALMNLIPTSRAYASEQDAVDAVESLRATTPNLEDDAVTLLSPSMLQASQAWLLSPGEKDGVDSNDALAELIISLHDGSSVPDSHALVYADTIQEGKTLLLVTAPFGEGKSVDFTLDKSKTVSMAEVPELEYHTWMQAAPLSALLNLPVLTDRRSALSRSFPELRATDKLPTEGVMGGLLTDNPTPLSSKFGMSALIDNPAPLSSKVGMSTLKDNPAPLSSKVGMSVLKDNPSPLSDKAGIDPLASQRSAEKESSFGLPLLSKNPSPLSSLFGLSVLKKND